jgi:tetratricopeptide (TPR) repeat protein
MDNMRQLGVAHQKLANSLGNPNYPNVGDYAGALQHIQSCARVFREATAAYPANALLRRLLAVANSNTADVLLALKRPAEALESQRRALAEFQALSIADPSNAAASNDLAISQSKIAEMLDAAGDRQAAVREYERALAIHQKLSASDPKNDSLQLEVASDVNRLATVQAKIGDRVSIANHDRAVTMTRALSQANTQNIELHVAVALALTGRGEARVHFKEWSQAERDYAEAVELLSKLQKEGSIQGTDVETLDSARKELDVIRSQRARAER